MSNGYIPTSKTNPCNVCGNAGNKCRSKEDGGKEFILCMTYGDSKFGERANGYKCIKEASTNKSYFGSTWTIDDSAEWTEEKRRKWERKKEENQLKQAKEEEYRKGRSLCAEERDREYRIVFDQLTLHPDHKADLIRRGFTEKQIIATGYKSVKKGHNYLNGCRINPLLPGASGGDGKHFFSPVDGYAWGVPDIDGRICAVNIRECDNAQTQKGNRYRWGNTKNQTLHLYTEQGSKELPLAIYKPQGKPSGVLLVEGTGIKPDLAANNLNCCVIGAAGGMFLGSHNLWRDALEKLVAEVGSKEIAIPPDAGDILNPSVMNRWERVVNQLIEWEYKPIILWWSQATKEDSDIDELTDYSNIKSISPDEFFQIAEKAQAEAKLAETKRQEKLKEEAENALYAELTGITEKPWLELNTPKLELDQYIENGAIYIILSAKGTEKTKSAKPIVKRFDAVYAWFSRIALGNEECKRIGIDFSKNTGFNSRNRVGFCANSSHKYSPEKLQNNGLLLIDETDQVLDHTFGDTCNKRGERPMIHAHLEAHLDAAIAGNGVALFMSADITQKEIDYIKELAPVGTPVRLIVNHYKPPKGHLYFDESDSPDGQIESLLDDLENGVPCFVIDDIKDGVRGCKSIAEYIRTVHPEWADKIVEINSDTSGDLKIINFLENINEASKEVLLICCSPSVVSGISIENGRFNRAVYGFFNGVLTISDASQALGRVRGAEITNVWAAEEGLVWAANRAIYPKEISDYYHRNYEVNSKHIQSFKPEYEPMTNEWSSPHWRLYCKNAAYRNLCMAKLRERLKAQLIAEGFRITTLNSAESDMVKKGMKEAWSKIELAEAEAVASAEIFSDDELEEIEFKNEALTPEEKLRLEKTKLFKSFGEELIRATSFEHKESGKNLTGYAAIYLKNERGVYKKQLDNFYLFVSDISEAISQDIARENRQLKHGFGRFPGDAKWMTRKHKARHHLNLAEFLDPGRWTLPSDYQRLAKEAKKHAGLIKDTLGVNVERMKYDSQIFTELMEQLGLKIDSVQCEGAIGTDGKRRRFRRRRINSESWQFAQMYVVYRQSLKAEAEAKREAYEAAKASSKPSEVKEVLQAPTEPSEEQFVPVQLELLRGGLDANQVVKSQRTELKEQPPLSISTESFLGGGCSIAESQMVKGFEPISEVSASESDIADLLGWIRGAIEMGDPGHAKDINVVIKDACQTMKARETIWSRLSPEEKRTFKRLIAA